MIIGGKLIKEIVIKDSTGGTLVIIDDEQVLNHKVVTVELIEEEVNSEYITYTT